VLENEKNEDNTVTSTLHYLNDKIFKAKDRKMNKEKDK